MLYYDVRQVKNQIM